MKNSQFSLSFIGVRQQYRILNDINELQDFKENF